MFGESNKVGSMDGKRSFGFPSIFQMSTTRLLIFFVACMAVMAVNTDEISQDKALTQQHSRDENSVQSESEVKVLEKKKNPRTVHELFSRLQRSGGAGVQETVGSSDGEQKTCFIEVQEVRRIPGRCIRLLGGSSACHAQEYLDPMTNECS